MCNLWSPLGSIFLNVLLEKKICQIKVCHGWRGWDSGSGSPDIILLNLSQGGKLGQYHFTCKMVWQAGIPAWGPSHTTNLQLIKQPCYLVTFWHPLAASLSDFLLIIFFSISRLCILLWVLQKYCFFFFLKLSFNQIAPAGMRCQRYSFQWIPAYAALPWQQDSEAEPWPWACQSLQLGGLSTSHSPAQQVVMPTINNKTHLSLF